MDRRLRLRRVTDQRAALHTAAGREAAVRAIMADRVAGWLIAKRIEPEVKVCARCLVPQGREAFAKGETSDGTRSTCRRCVKLDDRARRQVNKIRRDGRAVPVST